MPTYGAGNNTLTAGGTYSPTTKLKNSGGTAILDLSPDPAALVDFTIRSYPNVTTQINNNVGGYHLKLEPEGGTINLLSDGLSIAPISITFANNGTSAAGGTFIAGETVVNALPTGTITFGTATTDYTGTLIIGGGAGATGTMTIAPVLKYFGNAKDVIDDVEFVQAAGATYSVTKATPAGHQTVTIKDGSGHTLKFVDVGAALNGGNKGTWAWNDPKGPLTFVSDGGTGIDITCFLAGTLIATPDGQVAVEALKIGDPILAADGRTLPVRWIGVSTVSTVFADPLRVMPIRIRAGALAENTPARDLLVSPDHAMFVDGVLIQAGALVNGTSITREHNMPTTFKYYHVEVEGHALIVAEGAPTETFVDNVDRMAFDNWAEHEALYGHAPNGVELEYPRAKSARQVPMATRARLGERASRFVAALQEVA